MRTQVPYVLGFLVRSALLRPSVSPDVRQMHGRSLFRSFGGQRCGPRACVFHHVRVVLKQSTIEAGTSSTPSLPLTRPPRCASHSPETHDPHGRSTRLGTLLSQPYGNLDRSRRRERKTETSRDSGVIAGTGRRTSRAGKPGGRRSSAFDGTWISLHPRDTH